MKQVKMLLLTCLLFLAAACGGKEAEGGPTSLGMEDSAQVYAAAVREIHTAARSTTRVYLVTTTEDLAGAEAPAAPSQAIPGELQAAISAELAGERFETFWIAAFEEAPIEPADWRNTPGWRIAEGEGMVITLGNIHPQADGSMLLNFWMSCADMCGYGTTYVLSGALNQWRVTGQVGPELAS